MKIKSYLAFTFMLFTQFVMSQDEHARYTDNIEDESSGSLKFGWPLFIIIVIVAIIITKVKAKK